MLKRISNRRMRAALAGVGAVMGTMPATLQALTYTWTGASSSFWSVSSNWNPAGPPGNGDPVLIPSVSSTADTNVNYDYAGPAVSLATLTVSRSGLGIHTSILSMSAGNLSAKEENVGSSAGTVTGRGEINQSGGSNNTSFLILGVTGQDLGIYNLSGTGQLFGTIQQRCFIWVGSEGTGSFTQSGGSVTNTDLRLGGSVASHGTYTLTGGELAVAVGDVGTGTFNLSGGTAGFGSLTIGFELPGVFNQTGGVCNISFTTIGVGTVAGATTGTYNLSSGSLFFSLPSTIGGTGVLNYSGGELDVGSLTVYGKVLLSSGGGKVLRGLSVDLPGSAAVIDVNDNGMIVTSQTIDAIEAQIVRAYDVGKWDGAGITSSAASTNIASGHQTALGYAHASDLGATTFLGRPVSASDVLVRYTYCGDANLDGMVDTLDFNALAAHFGASGQSWNHGDFNYDGAIDTLDFNSLAANFGQSVPAAALDAPETPHASVLVPEPSVMMILPAFSLWTSLRQRRRFRFVFHVGSTAPHA